jgi:hypothetical protein
MQLPLVMNSFLLNLIKSISTNSKNQTKEFFLLFVWVTKALILRPSLSIPTEMMNQLQQVLRSSPASLSSSLNSWQDLYLQYFLSLIISSSSSDTSASSPSSSAVQTILTENGSLFFSILLQNQQQQFSETKPTMTVSSASSLPLLFAKEKRGNYSMFWSQKLFSQIFPLLSSSINPKDPVSSSSSSSSGVTTATATIVPTLSSQKLLVYFFFCQLITHIPSNLRQQHHSNLLNSLLMILSTLNVIETNKKHNLTVAVDKVIFSTEMNNLEKELFPSIELLLHDKPIAFYDSLHIIIPRLLKVFRFFLLFFSEFSLISFFFPSCFVCFALLCFALLCFALLCFALLCFALLCFALLCFVV